MPGRGGGRGVTSSTSAFLVRAGDLEMDDHATPRCRAVSSRYFSRHRTAQLGAAAKGNLL